MFARQTVVAAALAACVSAHATWQQLWINNVDYGSSCVRLPQSNSPVQSVTSNDLACNIAQATAPNTCSINAGDTLSVEMHQQPGDRNCATEAIGGQHYGPIMVYLAKVSNAATAVGSSSSWFKISEGGLMSNSPDYFANQVLNDNCGHYTFKIPSDIAPGDYLLRSETIALHTASSAGGAQFYMSCYQLRISGNGTATPPTVKLPGAYSASDPGILVNIHQALATYQIPGPAPYATPAPTVATTAWPTAPTINTANLPKTGFTTLPAGAPTGTPTSTATSTPANTTNTPTSTSTRPATTSVSTTTSAPAAIQTKYGQCGGQGYTGPTACEAGSTCKAISPPYYSQCV